MFRFVNHKRRKDTFIGRGIFNTLFCCTLMGHYSYVLFAFVPNFLLPSVPNLSCMDLNSYEVIADQQQEEKR